MTYNINQHVEYHDDFSYRENVRTVFGMNVCVDLDNDYDEVTKDELLYEENAMSKGLDAIYEKTKDVADFKKIYEISAGFMLSNDPNIGLAVIFSYDYFALFHLCLVDFLKTGSVTRENRDNLMKKISR